VTPLFTYVLSCNLAVNVHVIDLRYKVFASKVMDAHGDDLAKACKAVLDEINFDPENYKTGLTKARGF
jgi:hypothetical protein